MRHKRIQEQEAYFGRQRGSRAATGEDDGAAELKPAFSPEESGSRFDDGAPLGEP